MKGLPKDMKIKLLEHDPTPKLDDMLSFVRRYRAVQGHIVEHQVKYDAAGTSVEQNNKLSELVDLVKGMVKKQRQLEEAPTTTTVNATQSGGDIRRQTNRNFDRNSRVCYTKQHILPETAECRRAKSLSKDHVRIQYNVILVRVLDM